MAISARLIVNQAALKLKRDADRAADRRASSGRGDADELSRAACPPTRAGLRGRARSACCTASARRTDAAIEQRVAAILADVRARGDAAVLEYTRALRRLARRRRWPRWRSRRAELRAALDAHARRAARRARSRGRAHPRLPRAPAAARRWRSYRDARRHAARPAGHAARPRRHLRARRQGGLSVDRADERDAGEGGRRRRARHGGARRPDGERNALVLAAAALAGVDRVVHHRRRAGGRRARLRHRDGARGRQDLGPGQRLRGQRQAARVRHGRHRHDRRARARSWCSPTAATTADWVAMDLFRQAEHDELAQASCSCPTPAYIDAVRAAIERLLPAMPRRDDHPRLARRPRRADPTRATWTRPARSATASRPSTWSSRVAEPAALGAAAPPRRRDLPRRTTPAKAWATTAPARTTCCRPRARRAFPRRWASTTSRSARA